MNCISYVKYKTVTSKRYNYGIGVILWSAALRHYMFLCVKMTAEKATAAGIWLGRGQRVCRALFEEKKSRKPKSDRKSTFLKSRLLSVEAFSLMLFFFQKKWSVTFLAAHEKNCFDCNQLKASQLKTTQLASQPVLRVAVNNTEIKRFQVNKKGVYKMATLGYTMWIKM